MRRPIAMLIIITIVLLIPVNLSGQSREYLLKAGYIEKITHFIEWPNIRNCNDSVFKIVVIGNNKFNHSLEEIFNIVKVKNLKVQITYVRNVSELKFCNLLFVAETNSRSLQDILNFTKGKPILTISDTKGYAQAGCMINLYNENNKLRFEINQKAFKDAGLAIDYRLLRVSKILNPTAE